MTSRPRVVFGMPAYNRPDTLARTLESLLSQTYTNFALVIVDDAPTPQVSAIVERYCALDPRITYERNPVRLGMVGNWRKAYFRSRELFPGSDYFAWVSDHDEWHPRWLEALVPVLDTQPRVVLAYPQTVRMVNGQWRFADVVFHTFGLARPEDRLRAATEKMTAGNCIYGLFRAAALAEAGVFRPVILPDRQVLLELALLGQFQQVTEYLWYREAGRPFSYDRQRQAFFVGRAPVYTFLPAAVQHAGVLLWDFGVRGRRRRTGGRVAGVRYAALLLWYALKREIRLRRKRLQPEDRTATPAGEMV